MEFVATMGVVAFYVLNILSSFGVLVVASIAFHLHHAPLFLGTNIFFIFFLFL